MNKQFKTLLVVVASIFVGIGAIAYGAMTAPEPTQSPTSTPVTSSTPAAASTKKPTPSTSSKPKTDLHVQLKAERSTIESVLVAAYPKVSSDYVINQGQLFDEGQWYGTTLTYKGSDTMNRDTLRVLMQKKQGLWILRTTPPEPILSAKKYPDVPKSILKTINKAISLPGTDTSPTVNANE